MPILETIDIKLNRYELMILGGIWNSTYNPSELSDFDKRLDEFLKSPADNLKKYGQANIYLTTGLALQLKQIELLENTISKLQDIVNAIIKVGGDQEELERLNFQVKEMIQRNNEVSEAVELAFIDATKHNQWVSYRSNSFFKTDYKIDESDRVGLARALVTLKKKSLIERKGGKKRTTHVKFTQKGFLVCSQLIAQRVTIKE